MARKTSTTAKPAAAPAATKTVAKPKAEKPKLTPAQEIEKSLAKGVVAVLPFYDNGKPRWIAEDGETHVWGFRTGHRIEVRKDKESKTWLATVKNADGKVIATDVAMAAYKDSDAYVSIVREDALKTA